MFEKEVKERAKDYTENKERQVAYECGFLDGVDFAYNKANEWHYVKDEGLPINKNDGAIYLLFTVYGIGGSPVVAHFRGKDKQEFENLWTGAILTEDKIVAWKEIVLPELPKE